VVAVWLELKTAVLGMNWCSRMRNKQEKKRNAKVCALNWIS